MGIDLDEAKIKRNEPALWLAWTLATAAGLIIGYLPAALVVNEVDLGLARVLVPLLGGLLIGVTQWLVLRGYVTRSRDWVLNLAGGWVAGYALGLVVVEFIAVPVVGTVLAYIIFGAIVALFQWPVLRREIPHLWTWVLSNIVGWGLGALLSQVVIGALYGGQPARPLVVSLVSAAVTGLVAGALTGLALVRIVRQPEIAPAASTGGGK